MEHSADAGHLQLRHAASPDRGEECRRRSRTLSLQRPARHSRAAIGRRRGVLLGVGKRRQTVSLHSSLGQLFADGSAVRLGRQRQRHRNQRRWQRRTNTTASASSSTAACPMAANSIIVTSLAGNSAASTSTAHA